MAVKKKKPSPKKKSTKRLPPPSPPLPADQAAFDMAKVAFAAGALGEATAQAERAHGINPRRADVLALMAACWVKRGDQSRALDYARMATELDPGNPQCWENLGSSHLQLHQFPEAKTAYLRAISADPNFASAYYNLAKAELRLGETQAAGDHLVQALGLNGALAEGAKREFAALVGNPGLAEWLAVPEEKPAKGKKSKPKKAAKKPKRR